MPCPKISQTGSKKINTLLLLWLPINKLWREEHAKTKLGRGSGGPITVKKLDSNNTSLPPFPETTKLESSVLLPWLSTYESTLEHLLFPWLQEQSNIPSILWYPPSGRMGMETPQKTIIMRLDSFYRNNTAVSKITTPKKSNIRLFYTMKFQRWLSTNLPR